MEVIVFFAILYYIWRLIFKAGKQSKSGQKSRQARQKSAGQSRAEEKATRQAALENARRHFPQYSDGSLPHGDMDDNDEGESRYAPLQTGFDRMGNEPQAPVAIHSDYVGSLGGESHEGEDTCDPGLGHGAPATTRVAATMTHRFKPQTADDWDTPSGEMEPLQWNANAIVQGVIMSEILKRPSERKWGRR